MTLPKTVIVGATGFLGKYFFSAYRNVYPDCIGTSRDISRQGYSFFDLSSPDISSLKLKELGYKDALICAGISRLAVCEQEKELTRKINVDGITALVKQLFNEGIKPVFFSTNTIFDGLAENYNDESIPNPLNEYTRQKAEVESRIRKICSNGRYLIIRACKIFSLIKEDKTLLDEIASILHSGGIVQAAYDQIFSPTNVFDFVNAVIMLQMKDITGSIHVSSSEVWSRYDLALAMADHMRVSRDKVKKVSLDDLHEPFKRAKNPPVSNERMRQLIGINFTSVDSCIKIVAKQWAK